MTSITFAGSGLKLVSLYLVVAFAIAMAAAPLLTNFLYRNKIGKRLRTHGADGKAAPIFAALHAGKAGTPVMGGLLFWVTAAVLTALYNLDRGETWIPVFTLVAAGLIGAVDDLMNVTGRGGNGGGLRLKHKLWVYVGVALVGAWWFSAKLGFSTLSVPGIGTYDLGAWYVPLFLGVVIFTAFSVNQTDGLDGLAGGTSLFAFFVFTFIALAQGKVHLAVFCASLLGALLAFLWFNIYPARFFMGDTGSMALGMTLPILAFLTNSVAVLPFLMLIPYAEGVSTVMQIASKKFLKRKVFRVAPLHHHFEAIGWPEARVTMRFWIVSAVGCAAALMLVLAA